jgi:hypothetical protein
MRYALWIISWTIVAILCITWGFLEFYKIPIQDSYKKAWEDQSQTPTTSIKHPIEAGYVPGKSPDANKAEAHIILCLKNLPGEGPVRIISKQILVNPRPDGSWTEEWVAARGKSEIPIKIDFGVGMPDN